MNAHRLLTAGTVALCAITALPAQDRAADLHAAWLAELLDLDPARAQGDYRAIARRTDLPAPHRHLAVARLCELARVRPDPELDELLAAVDLPESLRNRLAEAMEAPPIAEIQAQLRTGIEAFDTWARELPFTGNSVLQPHPFVPSAYADALGALGPGQAERRQKLAAELAEARAVNDRRRVERLVRELRALESTGTRSQLWQMRATRVLTLMLDGRDDLAARLSGVWFRGRTAAIPGNASPAELVARAEERLAAELGAATLHSDERTVLERLASRLESWTAAGDHATALRFLVKVPVYGERLLGQETRTRNR